MSYDLTISGVSCNELHEGQGKESFDFTPENRQFAATRIFLCNWADRYTLLNGLKGQAHPAISGIYAQGFSVEGIGKPTGTTQNPYQWEKAKLTVGYKNFAYNPVDMKEIAVETSAETISLKGDSFEHESGGSDMEKKVDIDPKVFLAYTQITVTKHQQTSIAEATWDGFINCVNSAPFAVSTSPGFKTWPAGMLLYMGYAFTQKIDSGNVKTYEVSHKFLGSQIDHRMEFNPNTGDWDLVTTKVGGNYKYDQADFSGIGI